MAGKSGAVKAGRAFVELFADDSKLVRTLKKVRARMKAFGSFVTGIGRKMLAGVTAALVPIGLMVKLFANMGDQLDKISARTGVSVEMLSKLGFAAEQSGSDVDTLEKGLGAMGRFMRELERGSAKAVEDLKRLGLTMADLAHLTPDERITLLLKSLDKIKDPSIKAGLAMAILGRAGRQLLPMAKDFEKLSEQAEKLGIVLSKEDAAQAAKLTDSLNLLSKIVKMLAFQVGNSLSGGLIKAVDWLSKMTSKGIKWVKNNREMIRTVVKFLGVIAVAGTSLIALGVAIFGLNAVITLGISLWTGLGFAIGAVTTLIGFMVSPLGLVTAGIVVLLAKLVDWGKLTTKVTKKAGNEWHDFKDRALSAWGGIRDAIAAGDMKLAFKIVTLFMKGEWIRATNAMGATWGSFAKTIGDKHGMAVSNVAKNLVTAFGAIQLAWSNLATGMKSIWVSLWKFIRTHLNRAIGGLEKVWQKTREAFGFDRTKTDEEIDEVTQGIEKKIKQQSIDDKSRIAAERQNQFEEIDKRAGEQFDNVEQERARLAKERNDVFNADLAANTAELKKAQDELKALIVKARDKNKSKFGGIPGLGLAIGGAIRATQGATKKQITGKASVAFSKTGFDRFAGVGSNNNSLSTVNKNLVAVQKQLGKINKNTKQQIDRTVPLT